MLKFCENCNLLNEQEICRHCGKKNLREVNERDYCFLIEKDRMLGEMLMGILDNEGILYSAIPFGNGMRSQFGLRLENVRIFVPYEFYDRAKDLLDNIFDNFEKANSEELKNNIDRLFVSPRKEKKFKKLLKLSEHESVVDYCVDKIQNSDRVLNKGRIIGCTKGGDYLFVYKNNELIMINSVTYEIIAIKIET